MQVISSNENAKTGYPIFFAGVDNLLGGGNVGNAKSEYIMTKYYILKQVNVS